MSTKFLNIYNNLNNANYSFECKEKPLVLIFILDRLEKLQKILNDCSKNIFEEIYKQLFQEYLSELHLKQCSRNKQFEINYNAIDSYDINKNFKEELFQYFKNEFFKYFFCLILKLFMNNLKNILIDNYKKEIKENEEMIKIINEKAEYSLKSVTKNLKQKLNDDLKAGEKVNVTVEISYTKALDDSFKSSDDIIIELLDTSLTYSKK
jgi:hypothetical protein